jgi:integrase
VDLGWIGGKRRRKVVYGQTKADVISKVRALHNDSERGVDLSAESLTVTQLLER